MYSYNILRTVFTACFRARKYGSLSYQGLCCWAVIIVIDMKKMINLNKEKCGFDMLTEDPECSGLVVAMWSSVRNSKPFKE